MLRPFVMSLALLGLAANTLGADAPNSSPATWRWYVSKILVEQRESAGALAGAGASDFNQRYERYSVVGRPEAPRADTK